MMIAAQTRPDGQLLILGLTRVNVARLMSGQPMKITRESHGEAVPTGLTIGIMFGETEKQMRDEIIKTGIEIGKTDIDPNSMEEPRG